MTPPDHASSSVAPETPSGSPTPTRVQLFATCLVDQLFPDVGLAAADILERQGLTVEVPERQTCCGQPAFNAGFTRDARAMARHTIQVLAERTDPVVVPSGSCADMIVHQFAELLRDDPESVAAARELAGRTYELSQFLVDVLGAADVGAVARGRVTYHACCHGLRGLGIDRQPLRLLDAAPGLDRCPLAEADTCCGFGGLFAIKMANISTALLERKLEHIAGSDAGTVVVTDVSCLMHMQGGLRRRGSPVTVKHLAEVLRPA